ncbi:MAG TPA: tRNA pseudouridine(55) synthase TruB [Acidimicrobiales bacterium]|nr:tRNA pseudouridine(55) synthase TruB [Acidimicrobiales bacterium]
MTPVVDGVVVVDKPAGWTSHDVVARCRKIFGQKRVGHAGTLDPDATGVLVVGLGRATRLLRWVTDLPKSYSGELVLGVATSTLDASGEETGRWDMAGVPLSDVVAAAARFVGEIDQVPPMVSALKVGGQRLHALARAGVEVERAPRRVTVRRYDVGPAVEPGVFRIDVDCSSGTYVRSLAADVGTALGGGAHLRALRRTAVGPFTVDAAVPLDDVGSEVVRPPAAAVAHLAPAVVGPEVAAAVATGKVLPLDQLGAAGAGPWAVLDGAGALLAVYEAHGAGRAKPAVVLVS